MKISSQVQTVRVVSWSFCRLTLDTVVNGLVVPITIFSPLKVPGNKDGRYYY